MDKPDKYIIVYPESHDRLGIFRDLEAIQNTDIYVARNKTIHNRILQGIRHIHTSWTINKRVNLPFKDIWKRKVKFAIDPGTKYCVVFVDVAVDYANKTFLERLCNLPNVRCVLVCINSIDASSIGMLQVRKKLFEIPWHDVYTFDPGDREKYGFKDVKNAYYSYRQLPSEESADDVFFVGGMKGNREDLIFRMFKYLRDQGVKCKFYICALKAQMLHDPPFKDEICYYTGGWKPYEEILKQDLMANVIIEIMQEKQAGPSLRYYEAVCYNRKLITTNKRAAELPYFNPEYMKIIEKPEDIDIEWVKKRESIDYGYKGDFSPVHLLDAVLE